MRDPYEVLGLPRDCTLDDVKRMYKRLALERHPDKPGGGKEAFQELSDAFEVLTDPVKRAAFDRGARPAAEPPLPPFFAHMFGAAAGAGGPPAPLRVRIECSLADLYAGTSKTAEVVRRVECGACASRPRSTCLRCGGAGHVLNAQKIPGGAFAQYVSPCPACRSVGSVVDGGPCDTCQGVGTSTERFVMVARIPPGSPDSFSMAFRGLGDRGPHGAGDVVVDFARSDPGNRYERRGVHLVVKICVPLADALLGFTHELPGHPSGRVIRFRAGRVVARPPAFLVLEGLGMPRHADAEMFGDLYVRVDVQFPDSIDAEAVAAALGVSAATRPSPENDANVLEATAASPDVVFT